MIFTIIFHKVLANISLNSHRWLASSYYIQILGSRGDGRLSRNGDVSKQANEPLYLDEFYKDNKKVSRQLMEAGGGGASSDWGFQGDISE